MAVMMKKEAVVAVMMKKEAVVAVMMKKLMMGESKSRIRVG